MISQTGQAFDPTTGSFDKCGIYVRRLALFDVSPKVVRRRAEHARRLGNEVRAVMPGMSPATACSFRLAVAQSFNEVQAVMPGMSNPIGRTSDRLTSASMRSGR